jgi:hypothetical protein
MGNGYTPRKEAQWHRECLTVCDRQSRRGGIVLRVRLARERAGTVRR